MTVVTTFCKNRLARGGERDREKERARERERERERDGQKESEREGCLFIIFSVA